MYASEGGNRCGEGAKNDDEDFRKGFVGVQSMIQLKV